MIMAVYTPVSVWWGRELTLGLALVSEHLSIKKIVQKEA